MPRKILIADDNAINRQLLKETLGGEYDVLEAENGKEALTLLHRNFRMLSAALLDISMPEMDGYEVLRAARDSAVLAQIPIIIVTGSEDETSRVKALSLGANDFVLKPFNPEIIRHCLRNNIALRETASILNAIQRDKLTGLYNREAFFEKVRDMIGDRAPGFYVLSCFDIDNFKLINDQYGAAEGDRLLRETGKAVRRNMEEIGGIAARISADNFAALIPASEKVTDVLRRMLDRELVSLEQQAVTFSIGRYVVNDLSLAASAIYDRAYIAKQSVKGRYDVHLAYFDAAMLEKLLREQQITGEMEEALKKRQFEAWFQPQYDHATGVLLGAEALARWNHPQRGIIPPGEFIPLFEQNGFVYELDKTIWRAVCRALRVWLDKGYIPLPVSVNISRYDIFRADLLPVLTGLVREYDIPVDLLRLEITESAFSGGADRIVEIVKQLIKLGFTVEIDDFGSGYSSLNTLKNVPAQVVKLDMRFLEGEDDDQRGGNILESVVRMTRWLGMTVLAEGVERQEQADFLKSIGCTHVQGYLYARPMPALEYEALLADAGTRLRTFTLAQSAGRVGDDFWSPSSMDTLVFNNYSGGACVYEFRAGRIELIRITDKYICNVFGPEMSPSAALRIKWEEHVDPPTAEALAAALLESVKLKKEVTGEYCFLDLPGCPHETWLRSSLRVIASTDDRHLVYCTSENITHQREMIANLRMREEEYRLAAQLSNRVVCRYDVAGRTLSISSGVAPGYEMPEQIADVPYSQVREGWISPETAESYIGFYESILRGEARGEMVYQRKTAEGWRWMEARFAAIFSDTGKPVSAVVAFEDVNDNLAMEAVYRSWQQSVQGKKPESFSLFHCNLSKDAILGLINGSLLPQRFEQAGISLTLCTEDYIRERVYYEDAEAYAAFLAVNTLLEEYARGKRHKVLEYREQLSDGVTRWLRLTLDLFDAARPLDVEGYYLFEDINEEKREELAIMDRAENDPLTGVLNRATFAARVDRLLAASGPDTLHALLMLDLDGFKLVNDVFGHAVGDQTLIDIAGLLRRVSRHGDLLGRLGGDEFVFSLPDIPSRETAAKRAEQICRFSRKTFSLDVQISGSVGVVLWPQDGDNFETLYKKVDETLYYVKGTGKDNYAFYHGEMADDHAVQEQPNAERVNLQVARKKRRMLLVDDSRLDLELLEHMFREEYKIEKATDGATALIKLRHYGAAISIVLLDLMMPGMDGFAVLEKMQQSVEMRSIPVIVVTGADDRETNLRVIRAGATDFVNKPVDAEVLHIRVKSAISKSENERLRAQNSFLEMQSSEMTSYKTVLDRTGTLMVEHDWVKGRFTYSPNMSEHLAGRYDDRPLWLVLLSDLVADPETVRQMQQLDHDVANDRSRRDGSITVPLRAANGVKRPFTMNIYKRVNEYGLTDKLILTFREAEERQADGAARPEKI